MMYDMLRRSIIDGPSLFDPETVTVWRDEPCRHRRLRVLWDRIRGREHPDVHAIPLIHVALVDTTATADRPTAVRIRSNAAGIFEVEP